MLEMPEVGGVFMQQKRTEVPGRSREPLAVLHICDIRADIQKAGPASSSACHENHGRLVAR